MVALLKQTNELACWRAHKTTKIRQRGWGSSQSNLPTSPPTLTPPQDQPSSPDPPVRRLRDGGPRPPTAPTQRSGHQHGPGSGDPGGVTSPLTLRASRNGGKRTAATRVAGGHRRPRVSTVPVRHACRTSVGTEALLASADLRKAPRGHRKGQGTRRTLAWGVAPPPTQRPNPPSARQTGSRRSNGRKRARLPRVGTWAAWARTGGHTPPTKTRTN